MNKGPKGWFSISTPGSTILACSACRNEINLMSPSVDHHSSRCPVCGVESVFLSWKDRMVQILPQVAPAEFSRAIRWAQENLDELEFVSLLASLAEIVDAVQTKAELLQQK